MRRINKAATSARHAGSCTAVLYRPSLEMESKTVLLKYQENKKKVVIPLDEGANEMAFLKAAFRKLFNFEKQIDAAITFQRFDPDFEEFVDLEEDEELGNLEKLNVIVTPPANTVSKTMAVIDSDSDTELSSTPKRMCLDESSTVSPASGSDEIQTPTSVKDSLLPQRITFPGGKNKRIVKTENDSIPLPDPFPLPKHYQVSVEEALKSGKMPTKERRMFLSDIASSMLWYKRYPSRDDYICVSAAVVHAYPFLKATSGRPYDAIVQGLINRFKEFRRDKSIPRTKCSTTTTSHSNSQGKSPGITKPLETPQMPPGEDTVSCERHLKQLQAEFSKARRNPQIVSELMQKTYPLRRVEILEQPYDLVKLFERFPFLQEVDHLIQELEWILGGGGEKEKAQERWSGMRRKILEQGELESANNSKLSAFMADFHESTDDILKVLSILPFLLPDSRSKVDPNKFIFFSLGCTNITGVAKGNPNATPYILVTGDIGNEQTFLIIDKNVVSEVPLSCSLPFVLMAAFFAFNICYPKGCGNLYSFMEIVTLSYPESKASATVKHFLSNLNN